MSSVGGCFSQCFILSTALHCSLPSKVLCKYILSYYQTSTVPLKNRGEKQLEYKKNMSTNLLVAQLWSVTFMHVTVLNLSSVSWEALIQLYSTKLFTLQVPRHVHVHRWPLIFDYVLLGFCSILFFLHLRWTEWRSINVLFFRFFCRRNWRQRNCIHHQAWAKYMRRTQCTYEKRRCLPLLFLVLLAASMHVMHHSTLLTMYHGDVLVYMLREHVQ